jgi:hypothetical protein
MLNPPFTWHIFKELLTFFSDYVCVLKQSQCHMLNDALHSAITMYLKLKEEIKIPQTLVNLIDDD